MEDNKHDNFPPHPFLNVKRPDLRPDELPTEASPEELSAWKWWIQENELYDEIPEDIHPLERIQALDLNIYQEIHGTPDPSKILALFCFCHENSVYPPAWIMNELYKRFDEYLKGNSSGKKKRRLGEYFGEPARGDRSAFFRQEAIKPVMDSALTAVDRLRFCFDLSREDAISIAARRFELVTNKTSHRFEKGEAALEKAYREWCKTDHYQEWIDRTIINRVFTDEETKNFIKSFPPDSFTGHPHLEQLLKN